MYDRLGWVTDWEHTIFAVNVFCAFIKTLPNTPLSVLFMLPQTNRQLDLDG